MLSIILLIYSFESSRWAYNAKSARLRNDFDKKHLKNTLKLLSKLCPLDSENAIENV